MSAPKAQTAGRITLPDAVQIALKNNLGIQIAKNNVTVAGINNNYGIAGGLPVVSATATDQEQATSLKHVVLDLTLPGISVTTTPTDYRVNKQFQMVQFDGQRWQKLGDIVTDEAKE